MIEAFSCVRLPNRPKVTRASCASRHAAVERGRRPTDKGLSLYSPACSGCELGAAHLRGETPTSWADGRPVLLFQLTAATASPREEHPELIPALPPQPGPSGCSSPREVTDTGEENLPNQNERSAPSQERSEPGADPQTSPAAPAAPRRVAGRRKRKAPTLRPQTCEGCEVTYQPRSPRQKWCDECRDLPPSQRVPAEAAPQPAAPVVEPEGGGVEPPHLRGLTPWLAERHRALDLQIEVRAQLRALVEPGTSYTLRDVYDAVRAELAAYQAIRGGRA